MYLYVWHIQMPKDSPWELIFPSTIGDPGDGTYVLRLGSNCLYPGNHLNGPEGPLDSRILSTPMGLTNYRLKCLERSFICCEHVQMFLVIIP